MGDLTVLTVPVFSELCNLGFSLRRKVYIEEQKVPEAEEFEVDDLTACHIVAVRAGDVCGYLRVIALADHVKIGRVVVAQYARGTGIASAIIAKAIEDHRELRANRFYLTSQSDKIGLYQKFGFIAYGEEFLDGGMPHVAMKNY
jgi:predicted GNAT family N-acyltransferase